MADRINNRDWVVQWRQGLIHRTSGTYQQTLLSGRRLFFTVWMKYYLTIKLLCVIWRARLLSFLACLPAVVFCFMYHAWWFVRLLSLASRYWRWWFAVLRWWCLCLASLSLWHFSLQVISRSRTQYSGRKLENITLWRIEERSALGSSKWMN